VSTPITVDLAPFVEAERKPRGVVLEVRCRGDGTFELTTIVPGHGAKQGGVLDVQQLYHLGRRMCLVASVEMKRMFDATPPAATVETHRGS
jgi:hypothetical protein